MKKNLLTLCISLIFISILPAQESDPLQQAYQREFIYLDNEIRLLEERIEEVGEEGKERITSAQKELSVLEHFHAIPERYRQKDYLPTLTTQLLFYRGS